jgi:hypothetical protein
VRNRVTTWVYGSIEYPRHIGDLASVFSRISKRNTGTTSVRCASQLKVNDLSWKYTREHPPNGRNMKPRRVWRQWSQWFSYVSLRHASNLVGLRVSENDCRDNCDVRQKEIYKLSHTWRQGFKLQTPVLLTDKHRAFCDVHKNKAHVQHLRYDSDNWQGYIDSWRYASKRRRHL